MTVDLERYIRGRVRVLNDSGGRGYDGGLRTFDCPLCGERRGRGWVGVQGWGAGCFNTGCVAEPTLRGGVVEWVRLAEHLYERSDAWRFLREGFGTDAPSRPVPPAPHRGSDFCTFPEEARLFRLEENQFQRLMQGPFEQFLKRQWGLEVGHAREWGLGWCLSGRYAWRVIIPVVMGGAPVAFQARTIADHSPAAQVRTPKYLTSSNVPAGRHPAECGRSAASLLFNIDALAPGGEAVLVEGSGDSMRWHRDDRGRSPVAVALLGTALTPEKLAILATRRPERVVVAMDAEPEAWVKATAHVADLRAWGMDARMGTWRGAKDAGAGATLDVGDVGEVASFVRSRLDRR